MALLPAPALAAPSDPAQWPELPRLDPELTATPHTIRFSGPDRYQTNLAMNLALRGAGAFPFDTSDRTSGNASGLAEAGDWWGAASCPRAIILVAGDTFADALAAASLSDPGDRAHHPQAQRVAAADPVFDPVGARDRIESAYAPIVVTDSARAGATALAQTARQTADDFARGGCATAREAIVVGGPAAVPVGVEGELLGLGYEEVFRIAGADRYDTAARVAAALQVSAVPDGTPCLDADSTDGTTRLGFHGNAAPEYRSDAQHCTVLPRAVVLADGGTGADALAAGWWTSRWQVPVLLTAPDGTLPGATRAALESLDVDTIIVLGGVGRIPESTVDAARALAGAGRSGRIAGTDRYETSVAMAKAFGGWHPTGDGRDFAGDVVCTAGSSGSGSAATGWADALAAGPLCARLAVAAAGGPARALPPVAGAEADVASAGGARPAHDAIPILLVPSGAEALPEALRGLLSAAFDPSAPWCSADDSSESCVGPGFGVILAGIGVVGRGVALELNDLVSGGFGGDRGEAAPALGAGFATRLDLRPSFAVLGTGAMRHCFPPGAFRDIRWLSLWEDTDRRRFVGEADVLRTGAYEQDGASAATCIATDRAAATTVTGASLSGVATAPRHLALDPGGYVSTSGPITQRGTASGSASETSWSFDGTPSVRVNEGAASEQVERATLNLRLTVGASGTEGTFDGTAVVTTRMGDTDLLLSGLAVRSGDGWELRGRAELSIRGGAQARGGFQATLSGADDGVAAWQFDGFR